MSQTAFDQPARRVSLHVRLLPEPGLWCWEIRDVAEGRLLGSSWEDEWTGFETAGAAWAAGRARLHHRGTRRPV
jgi:hypothetical protein